jgi:hypothetical protein
MAEFETKDSGQRIDLANGMVRDTSEGKEDYTLLLDGPLFKRWAELLTRGAVKYGKRNWCKALKSADKVAREETKARFKESAMRHMMQWLQGNRDEDHAAAVLFNLNGYEAMLDTDPPMHTLERHAQPAADSKRTVCNVASANTEGRFYCSREGGHSGPCAAHPLCPTVAELDREIEAGFGQSAYKKGSEPL